MHITKHTAALINRALKICCIAFLSGVVVIWSTLDKKEEPAAVVFAANHRFKIMPLEYPKFDDLISRYSRPFELAHEPFMKRSIMVEEIEESKSFIEEDQEYEEEPLPGPEIQDITIFAVMLDSNPPRVIYQDSKTVEIKTAKLGETVVNSRLVKISPGFITFERNGITEEIQLH
jgi:hypothetical protein